MSAPRVDAREFRQRYLETLRKQIAVNEKNLQANTLFKQTQQPTPLEDTRTITEKTADEVQLSNLLRRELSKLTDSGSASQIVASLSLPDKKKLIENFGAVEEQLRRRFKFGFTKETFFPFFQKFIESLEETGGFAPTATQIAEKVAPAVTTAISEDYQEGDVDKVMTEVFQMPKEEIDRKYPKGRSRAWKDTREFLQSSIKQAIDEGDASLKPFRKWMVDNRTKSAREYRDHFDTLSPEIKDTVFEVTIGIPYQSPPVPTASAVDEEDEFIVRPATASGRGLSKSSSKSKETLTPNITLSVSGGIPAEARFANFGRYLIDKGALKDNLAVVRFTSGACIHQIPKQKISNSMSKVLKTIAGGSLPSYDEIDSLNNDERRWLYDVSKKARLDINVPNPKKDEETREMETFEKMKGQIIAGNDNKDLVKQFKFLLLKLAREGRIPKREANEVLMEMAMVGL